MRYFITCLIASASCASYAWSCDLAVDSAWIREPPPTASVLGGYALLTNRGQKTLTVAPPQSELFARIEMHESLLKNGVAQMRALPSVTLSPGQQLRFEPNGRHLMLMGPKRLLKRGDRVPIAFKDDSGCVTTRWFTVSQAAANPATEMSESMHMDMSTAPP